MTKHNAALQHQRDQEHRDNVEHAIREAAGATEPDDDKVYYLDPADATKLRGIPAVGGRGSLGGHITDTRPDHLPFAHEYRHHHRRKL